MNRHLSHLVVLLVILALGAGTGLAPLGTAALAAREVPPRAVEGPQQHTFEVDSNSDDANAEDKNPGDCICESWLNECTLRAAIMEANHCTGADTVTFDDTLQGTTIFVSSAVGPMPSIQHEQLTIDASSVWDDVNDRPGITLNGGTVVATGLSLESDGCQITGLFITGFSQYGVLVSSAYNYIGGPYVGQRNVIGSNGTGVMLISISAHDNNIRGNWIGLTPEGGTAAPNSIGIEISVDANDNTIGGSTSSEGNIISGNSHEGIYITANDNNSIGANLIGLQADGTSPLGNGSDGISIRGGAQGTIVGGSLAANTISYNLGVGVYIINSSTTTVLGNTINDNTLHGVYANDAPDNRVIANTIAYNGGHGVLVSYAGATGNLIVANSIHDNTAAGIHLQSGGNGELPAPTITSAAPDRVEGTACANCMIHVYSDSADEGEVYHGPTNADAAGSWVYTGTISGPNATATNTDSGNNTSMFSAPVSVTIPCTPVTGVTISGPTSGDPGVAVCFTATVSPGDATTPIDYTWDPLPDGQGTPFVCYTWMDPGTYVITVTVSNCQGAGTASDTHVVTISSACIPLTGVTISGPTSGLVDVPYGFSAAVTPANATQPIDYTWTPAPGSGQGSANATYTWATPGTYQISVQVTNCSGTGVATDDHSITISTVQVYQVYLPVIHR